MGGPFVTSGFDETAVFSGYLSATAENTTTVAEPGGKKGERKGQKTANAKIAKTPPRGGESNGGDPGPDRQTQGGNAGWPAHGLRGFLSTAAKKHGRRVRSLLAVRHPA
jgi:hypothetical protein